ncbi:hypothetical protein [Paenibacillus faecalis]|uniref:hypothetical protein n=1 Tax=Paenibacillus faecalis TaxID=2079532 RepID=UPI000D0F3073|nr:hypothetical protein [Paenibacillus faecalis]
MNELSRMERHQSRHKGRKKNKKAASGHTAKRSQNQKEFKRKPESSSHDEVIISRSRRRSKSDGTQTSYAATRSGKTGELSRTKSARMTNHEVLEEESAPSRTKTYPSHRVRMSKWFVNTLIVLFILLMAGLLFWGLIGAPPLEEIF